jgi:hypothetical protein
MMMATAARTARDTRKCHDRQCCHTAFRCLALKIANIVINENKGAERLLRAIAAVAELLSRRSDEQRRQCVADLRDFK